MPSQSETRRWVAAVQANQRSGGGGQRRGGYQTDVQRWVSAVNRNNGVKYNNQTAFYDRSRSSPVDYGARNDAGAQRARVNFYLRTIAERRNRPYANGRQQGANGVYNTGGSSRGRSGVIPGYDGMGRPLNRRATPPKVLGYSAHYRQGIGRGKDIQDRRYLSGRVGSPSIRARSNSMPRSKFF